MGITTNILSKSPGSLIKAGEPVSLKNISTLFWTQFIDNQALTIISICLVINFLESFFESLILLEKSTLMNSAEIFTKDVSKHGLSKG